MSTTSIRREFVRTLLAGTAGLSQRLLPRCCYGISGITPHRTASNPTTVQAMAMRAAMRDSPAISPEATGT